MSLVAIGFDGTLARCEGWNGDRTTPGDPLRGARRFVQRLRENGYTPYILTARTDFDVVKSWLEEHGFPPMEVTNVKLPAVAYIDDLGHRFDGDYERAFRAVVDSQPWWWWATKYSETLGVAI